MVLPGSPATLLTMETTDNAPRRDWGRSVRSGVVAAGAALGMTLAGLGIAAAQTDDTTTGVAPAQTPAAPDAGAPAPPPDKPFFGGHHGPKGPGMGLHGGIHGEFTTRAPGGGYQTIATQHGEVTAVSASSLTVKSEDGFSRTYAVDDNTLVNAGNEGIADVKVGDTVHVMAIVTDGKASAVDVHDGTRIRESRDRWMPRPPSGD